LVIATLFVLAPFAPAVNTQRVVADIEVAFPSGLAYDSGRSEIFALSPNYSEVYAGTIVVISDATDQVVATISAGSGPSGSIHLLGAAYDSDRGEVFVTDADSCDVLAISDATNALTNTVCDVPYPSYAGTTGAFGIAYDAGRSEVFVANSNSTSNAVSVMNDSTYAVTAYIPIGSRVPGSTGFAPSVAYDSSKGEVFATGLGSEIVSVISDATNEVLANVSVGFPVSSLAYDSGTGEVFAAEPGANTVSVISDATNKVVATISAGNGTPADYYWGLAYDSGRGEIFVPESNTNTVSVISDQTDQVAATLGVSGGPSEAVYDPGKSEVFVADSGDGFVTAISDVPGSTTSMTSSATGTQTSSTSASNGIPEFPGQLVAITIFSAMLVASYVLVRIRKSKRSPCAGLTIKNF